MDKVINEQEIETVNKLTGESSYVDGDGFLRLSHKKGGAFEKFLESKKANKEKGE